jgi:hypothetical protein
MILSHLFGRFSILAAFTFFLILYVKGSPKNLYTNFLLMIGLKENSF